jgi:hypothetical protein
MYTESIIARQRTHVNDAVKTASGTTLPIILSEARYGHNREFPDAVVLTLTLTPAPTDDGVADFVQVTYGGAFLNLLRRE